MSIHTLKQIGQDGKLGEKDVGKAVNNIYVAQYHDYKVTRDG
jgi:hypothetical protein